MTYQIILHEIESDIRSTQDRLNGLPCPVGCFHCCRDVATMTRISAIEAEYVLVGLRQLSESTLQEIYDRSIATIRVLEEKGWRKEAIMKDGGVSALESLKGVDGCAECPMLIDGRCSVYAHRPLICRAWGHPIILSDALDCCHKTIIFDVKRDFKPIYYPYYEYQCDKLSQASVLPHRLPVVYLVEQLTRTLLGIDRG